MLSPLRTLAFFITLLIPLKVYSVTPASEWVSLDADSQSRLRRIIQSEVESREGFSTIEEDRSNVRKVEEQRLKEMSAYKAAINAANSEFLRTKKRRDDLTAQFQTASYDFEELLKNVETLRKGIENIDNQISRYRQDIATQQESLKKWLMAEKQGEAIVAVIYTRGFKDKAHDLESLADRVSAPLMAQYMGTYIKSFTKVIDNVLTVDFIKAIEEGTAKWNRQEPMRVVLRKGTQGTTYLRIKRYELYPFQAPTTGRITLQGEEKGTKVAVITTTNDLKSFLMQNNYPPESYALGRVDTMIRETNLNNRQAEAGLREQLISYRERINYLQGKITSTQSDREFQLPRLKEKQDQLEKLQTELQVIKLKKDSAEMVFQNAQASLYDKKRIHESIIVKTSLATTKRSQTPAEASAEAIIDKLEEVRNDAKMQHSSSTTDVKDFEVVGESSTQAVTEAKIVAVRLISFINEGDSVRVKMAFRVKTTLGERPMEADKADSGLYPSESMSPKVATQTPSPPEAKTEAPIRIPSDAGEKIPAYAPKRASKAIAAAEALQVLFELTDVKKSAEELTFFVEATNKGQGTKYIAFYDETSRYTRSTLTDESGRSHSVNQVYLWQGDQKISSYEASRGVAVEPGNFIRVEMIFKKIPPDIKMIKLLNLHPYAGVRMLFYRWSSTDLPFRNIQIQR